MLESVSNLRSIKTGVQSGIIGDDTFIQKIIDSTYNKGGELGITSTGLIEQICAKYGFSKSEIVSQNRGRDLAHVRAVRRVRGDL